MTVASHTDAAVGWLLEMSQRITFDPFDEAGRAVVHGVTRAYRHPSRSRHSRCYADRRCPVTDFAVNISIKGIFTFAEDRGAPASCKRHNLLKICNHCRLENRDERLSSAGWIACAQIGGVLDWRPRLDYWAQGSGKIIHHEQPNPSMLGKTVYRFNHRQLRAGIGQSLQRRCEACSF